MHRTQPVTPLERNRAVQRLRGTTLGVALASIGATLGMGWVTAVSDPGSPAVASDTSTASSSSATSSSSGDATDDSSSLGSTGQVGSSASGTGQATSGGS